jgi:hypothetical protein
LAIRGGDAHVDPAFVMDVFDPLSFLDLLILVSDLRRIKSNNFKEPSNAKFVPYSFRVVQNNLMPTVALLIDNVEVVFLVSREVLASLLVDSLDFVAHLLAK